MAKKNNTDLKDLQDSIPKETKVNAKMQKVIFKEMMRADFGAFNEGDFAELPAVLAAELRIAGIVEFSNAIPEVKNDEDFI